MFLICRCVILAAALIFETEGFNIDITMPIISTGSDGSEFGFSVALHKEGNDYLQIIGAPNSTKKISEKIHHGGAYKCPVNESLEQHYNCSEIKFSYSEGEFRRLGSTIRSGLNERLIVCDPNFIHASAVMRIASGMCYRMENSNDPFIYRPCGNKRDNGPKPKGVTCQGGFSADMNENQMVTGGPSAFAGYGRLLFESFQPTKTVRSAFNRSTSTQRYSGYSVAFANLSTGNDVDIIIAAPRDNMMTGAAELYSFDRLSKFQRVNAITPIQRILGKDMGSYFGNAVIVTDISGDGLDDLIVSAPSFSKPDAFEVGKIYIYHQRSEGTLVENPTTTITGSIQRGKFGYSLVALGDIDRDGFNDIAVGAPYANAGVVYIYNGRSGGFGINPEPSQVIRAKDVDKNNLGIRTFGFSLSGGYDVDENGYPDLLIGAPESNSAVLLKSRPVLSVELKIQFSVDRIFARDKDFPDVDFSVTRFTITTCLTYGGVGTPEEHSFILHWELDSATNLQTRALFVDNISRSISNSLTATKGSDSNCKTLNVTLKQISGKHLSLLQVKVTARQNPNNINASNALPPIIINENVTKTETVQVLLADCPTDDSPCAPNLQLSLSNIMNKTITIGDAKGYIKFTVRIENKGYGALEPFLFAEFPDGIEFAVKKREGTNIYVSCKEETYGIKCNFVNWFPTNMVVEFDIICNTAKFLGSSSHIAIYLKVNSSDSDKNETDNHASVNVTVEPKIEVQLLGGYNRANVYAVNLQEPSFYKTLTSLQDIDEEIIHTYTVKNVGPSNFSEATLNITWPSKIDGFDLLRNVTLSDGCQVELAQEPSEQQLRYERGFDEDNVSSERKVSLTRKNDNTSSNVIEANCRNGVSECVTIICNISHLAKQERSTITVSSRLSRHGLASALEAREIYLQEWIISSTAYLQVTRLPYTWVTSFDAVELSYSVYLAVTATRLPAKQEPIPLWMILLAIFIACLILAIITLILCKVGFFKRKRVDAKFRASVIIHQSQALPEDSMPFTDPEETESFMVENALNTENTSVGKDG